MTNAEFQHELRNLHTRTLEEGPNWREVALITADELAAYVRHTTQYEDDIPAAMAVVIERMNLTSLIEDEVVRDYPPIGAN